MASCAVCGRAIKPHVGRGRPRVVCGKWCSRQRSRTRQQRADPTPVAGGMTADAVGAALGIPSRTVLDIEARALAKLRCNPLLRELWKS